MWAAICDSSRTRVGSPNGYAYGVDMTEEMLTLANANKVRAGVHNVEFRKGTIEDVPLPDACVDVVISHCVINPATDKPAVLPRCSGFWCLVDGSGFATS